MKATFHIPTDPDPCAETRDLPVNRWQEFPIVAYVTANGNGIAVLRDRRSVYRDRARFQTQRCGFADLEVFLKRDRAESKLCFKGDTPEEAVRAAINGGRKVFGCYSIAEMVDLATRNGLKTC